MNPDAHLENLGLFRDVQANNLERRNVMTVKTRKTPDSHEMEPI
jgi:hypothetical protein